MRRVQLKEDFVLSLPETFDDGKPVRVIRKESITDEEQVLLKAIMDFASADLIRAGIDEDDLY